MSGVDANDQESTVPAGSPAVSDSASKNPGQNSRETLGQLYQKFRVIKHDSNNCMAVMMALAEMTKRNPEYSERLADSVLGRGRELVDKMREFGEEFREFTETREPGSTK